MKVFISYSWDDENHKEWVRQLADALIKNGIDTVVDEYDLTLGSDVYYFMETAVRSADCILCVCTPDYVQRANQREKGVGAETTLITPAFFEAERAKQFIPIIRSTAEGIPPTPDYMASLVYVDFRNDAQFTRRLEELLRHLHKRPKHKKPELGSPPNFDEPLLKSGGTSAATKRVLIIEDEINLARSLGSFFKTMNIEALVTYSLEPALELARREPVDIVLTDIWEADMMGKDRSPLYRQAASYLKELSPQVKIIGMVHRDPPDWEFIDFFVRKDTITFEWLASLVSDPPD